MRKHSSLFASIFTIGVLTIGNHSSLRAEAPPDPKYHNPISKKKAPWDTYIKNCPKDFLIVEGTVLKDPGEISVKIIGPEEQAPSGYSNVAIKLNKVLYGFNASLAAGSELETKLLNMQGGEVWHKEFDLKAGQTFYFVLRLNDAYGIAGYHIKYVLKKEDAPGFEEKCELMQKRVTALDQPAEGH